MCEKVKKPSLFMRGLMGFCFGLAIGLAAMAGVMIGYGRNVVVRAEDCTSVGLVRIPPDLPVDSRLAKSE